MKKFIFSKKYLKTKLGLITLLTTILYHFICKETDYNMEVNRPKEEIIVKNVKTKALVHFHKENDELIAELPRVKQMDNLEIIHSEWILDYWQKITNRKQALKIPNLPNEFNSRDFKDLKIDEFLNSEIFEDLIKLVNSERYFSKKNGLEEKNIVLDLIAFSGKKRLSKVMFTFNAFLNGLLKRMCG